MAKYSLGVRTTSGTTGTAAAECRSSSTDRIFIREIHIYMGAATASSFGVGRPAAIGVTPTSPVTWLAEDPANPAGTASLALAWATGPTVPTAFLRRVSLPGTIGAGVIFVFPDGPGLVIPISNSLVVWNSATNGVADVVFVGDE